MKLIIATLCLLVSTVCFAQQPGPKELQTTVAGIAQQIEDHYVYPQRGKQIAAHLRAEHEKGIFSNCRSWKMFDSLATASLRAYSHDGHLYVRNDPGTVKNLRERATKADTAEAFNYELFYSGPDAVQNNFGFREVKVMEANVGYIRLSEINISAKSLPVLFAAMRFVANTKALIIDLRDNGGGGSEVGAVLESFFLPKDVPLLEFKSRHGESTVEKTVSWLTEPKYEQPLFVLINKGTASAAEAFAYSLQNAKRAVIIGQPSAGGAHMNTWYPVNDEIYVSVSTAAPARPGTEESWEQKGVQPDHVTKTGKEMETVLRLLQ